MSAKQNPEPPAAIAPETEVKDRPRRRRRPARKAEARWEGPIRVIEMPDAETFSILHMSDLHFSRTRTEPSDRYDPRVQGRPKEQCVEMHNDLSRSAVEHGIVPNCVVVSGDLAETGTRGSEYTAHVFKDLSELSNVWFSGPSSHDNFVIIPGNHDVHWDFNATDAGREATVYKDSLYGFYGSRDELNTIFVSYPFLWDLRLFRCKGFTVFVCGLESTLIETEKRRGIGYISPLQMEKATELMRSAGILEDTTCIKIAVIHHHVLPVGADIELDFNSGSFELKNTKFSLLQDSRNFLDWLAVNRFSMVMHGHQHTPFVATERRCNGKNREIIISGAGSISKMLGTDRDAGLDNNYFNVIDISREGKLTIRTFRAKDRRTFGFIKHGEYPFQISPQPSSARSHICTALDNFINNYTTVPSQQGGGTTQYDVTEFFAGNPIRETLGEILLAIGALEQRGGRINLVQYKSDSIALSFIKSLSRYLKIRDDSAPTLLSGWASMTGSQHNEPLSPLLFTAAIEKKLFDETRANQGLHERLYSSSGDLRQDYYMLFPVFGCDSSTQELKILLYLHQSWRVYLIPTAKLSGNGAHPNPLQKVYEKYFGTYNISPTYVTQEKDYPTIRNIEIQRTPRPSPSCGALTDYKFDMKFIGITEPGFMKILEHTTSGWTWLTLSQCENFDHINIDDECIKKMQYTAPNALFPNNLDVIRYAFTKAAELRDAGRLVIHPLR